MNTEVVGRIGRVLGRATRKIVRQPGEAVLRARMAGWVLLIVTLARLTSLPRAQRVAMLGIRSPSRRRASYTPEQLASAIDAVLGMDLFVFRPSCWKRAMVLQRFLALNGIESRVRFGVRKAADGRVDGHAWLEHEGRLLLEREAGSYVVTFTLPPEAAGARERSAG